MHLRIYGAPEIGEFNSDSFKIPLHNLDFGATLRAISHFRKVGDRFASTCICGGAAEGSREFSLSQFFNHPVELSHVQRTLFGRQLD